MSTTDPRPSTDRDARIAAYGVVDDVQRPDLRALAGLAARVVGVPMAVVNLLTSDRQHQVATVGFAPMSCDLESSMCRWVLSSGRAIALSDASLDPRFVDSPFVNGELGNVRFYASHPLVTPQGEVIGSLCVFDEVPHVMPEGMDRDLGTLARQVVDVLELELVRRRLDSFAGQVSHDLANPLAGIGMSVQLAREQLDAGDLDDVRALLDRAERTVGRMTGVLQDMLTVARGTESVRTEVVDLERLVADAVEDLGDEAAAVVRVEGLPVVRHEETPLRIVVQNLLGNAVKFSRGAADKEVVVRADRVEGRWVLEVVDHGPGVAEADRERVFEPLVRLDEHAGVPGSGIGLSTVQRVVRGLGGEVGVRPTPGGGATFWVELAEGAG